jgi:hypothetical protein
MMMLNYVLSDCRNALLWNPRTPIPAVKVVLNASNKINEEKQRVWMQVPLSLIPID